MDLCKKVLEQKKDIKNVTKESGMKISSVQSLTKKWKMRPSWCWFHDGVKTLYELGYVNFLSKSLGEFL